MTFLSVAALQCTTYTLQKHIISSRICFIISKRVALFFIPLPLKTPLHLAIPGPSTPEESPAPEGLKRVTVVGYEM